MIYFDNAATSFPKPPAVIRKTADCQKHFCGNPGRGAHKLSLAASECVYACREKLADLFDAAPERVIFTYNTTYALNLAIKSFYSEGAVLISDLEHNSVRRPCATLTDDLRIFDSHPELPDGNERDDAILSSIEALSDGVKMLVCTAASNIVNLTLPIEKIGAFCREKKILFLVDAAQAAGHFRLSVRDSQIDALCLPGHKGLYGPQGTGVLILGENALPSHSFLEGGSGVSSRSLTMPDYPPERFEAGTLAVPAIAGLSVGLDEIVKIGLDRIAEHEKKLFCRLREYLKKGLGGKITIYEKERPGSIFLFNIDGIPSEKVAAALDERGFCVRAGLHCSPLAHDRIGTGDGAVRVSFGIQHTLRETDRLAEAIIAVAEKG